MTTPLLVTRMPREVAPGTEGMIHFKLDTANLAGEFEGAILVFLNDPGLPQASLSFTGRIVPAIELSPMPAFFVAGPRGRGGRAAIEIVNHESEPLRIEKIDHPKERFTTELETLELGKRYRLILTLKATGPGGKARDTILIGTSNKRMPVLEAVANTYLYERVHTFPDVVDFGTYRVGDAARNALPADLVERFERMGWLLIRNYNEHIGASIAEAFGTDDRHAVESYCRANAIQFEWKPNGGLRTCQRRSAVVRHPRTGQRCWFNQIAFLNEWTMDPELREYLVDIYGEDGLPFNSRFGNGDPIGADVIQLIDEVYEKNTSRERWRAGDLMLVDNVRTAHARESFEGPREVLVAMADAVHLADCSPTIEVTAS